VYHFEDQKVSGVPSQSVSSTEKQFKMQRRLARSMLQLYGVAHSELLSAD
jgi:hypothetical protein